MNTPPIWDPTEEEFAAWVIEAAERMGWRVFRTHDSRRSPSGEPDLRIVPRREGRVAGRRPIWAELKKRGGTVKDDQADAIADLRACGQTVRVWYPQDQSSILVLLERREE